MDLRFLRSSAVPNLTIVTADHKISVLLITTNFISFQTDNLISFSQSILYSQSLRQNRQTE